MSTVYLHVGQCGVQIGKEYWKDVICKSHIDRCVKHTHFAATGPRALFIDAERKVIQKFVEETKKSKIYKELNVSENSIRCRKGCGSNWGMGYNALGSHVMGNDVPHMRAGFGKFLVDGDSTMLEVCVEAVRTKVEACDSFSGFLCMSSLAGGTGSGWGARLAEVLCDMYPTAYRLWNVVTPHSNGESPTQHYNQLLSLAKLQECTDAIVLFPNDQMLSLATRRARAEACSLDDMNKMIAEIMQSLYLPLSSLTPTAGGVSVGVEPWEMIRSVAAMPSHKFLQTRHAASLDQDTTYKVWDKLLRNTTTATSRDTGDRCLASLCVCRGVSATSMPDTKRIRDKLKKLLQFVEWNPFPVDFWLDEPSKLSSQTSNRRSLTLCINCSSTGKYMQSIYDKAHIMFSSRAYLHWYAKYGLEHENFANAFDTLGNVIAEYQQLC